MLNGQINLQHVGKKIMEMGIKWDFKKYLNFYLSIMTKF